MLIRDGSIIMLDDGRWLMPLHPIAKDIINTIQSDASINLSNDDSLYINFIVSNYIEQGLWTKTKGLYGIVGGTSATHRWNWKDMRDDDDAFRLSFLGGGWIHSATGAKPNGTSSYANTFLNPNVQGLTNINNHLSVYTTTTITANQNIITSRNNMVTPSILSLSKSTTGTNYSTSNSIARGNNLSVIAAGQNLGYTVASALGTTIIMLTNGIAYQMFNSSLGSDLPPNYDIYLCSGNVEGVAQDFSNTELKFVSIGEGLTNQQAFLMTQIITMAQGILNRK